MKRIYVDERWCLGCHLCEYYCAFANAGGNPKETCGEQIAKIMKSITIRPRIQIEEQDNISFAVSCRHCKEPLCVKSCISGALTREDGIIRINRDKCVGCYTCVLVCPYGAIMPGEQSSAETQGPMQKCELCVQNTGGTPACVQGCPNKAIIFVEEKAEAVDSTEAAVSREKTAAEREAGAGRRESR